MQPSPSPLSTSPPSCPETATWSWDNNTPFFANRRSTRSVAYCVRSSVASTRLGALAVVLTWGQTDIVTQVFSSTRLFSVLHKPHFCTFATPSPFSERAAHALCAFPRGFLLFFLLSSTKPLPPFHPPQRFPYSRNIERCQNVSPRSAGLWAMAPAVQVLVESLWISIASHLSHPHCSALST